MDDSDDKIRRLIDKCRSNDIDAKVDAITKLQAEVEAGTEVPDADRDALLAVLKACLRTPNQHLTTPTLSALPPLLPLLVARPAHAAASASGSPAASTSSAASATLVDAYALRQAMQALLPAGGVVDRLGDSRERAREKARETLVVLGGLAFRGGGPTPGASKARDAKGPETPLTMFERALREQGLASKVWRVREQAILTLVSIRRAHHMFPIRPFLPALVEALEDTDGAVRECARQSVVELFTGPGVTDAARADLKKEMAKKNVRKTIVDGVLARLLAGSTGGGSTPGTQSEAGSENGDAPKEYVPPSIALMNRTRAGTGGAAAGAMSRSTSHSNVAQMSRPSSRAATQSPLPAEAAPAPPAGVGVADIKAVYIASDRDLEQEFSSMLKHFEGKETEHNWAPREQSVQRVRGMLKGDVHERFTEVFMRGLKNGFIDASLKTLASLRTTVAANTCMLYAELAIALGPAFDPFCETVLSALFRMASLTKKITAQQSQTTATMIISHTGAHPRLVPSLIWSMLQDKAIQTRAYMVSHVKSYLEAHGTRHRNIIEAAGAADTLEKCVKRALADPNAGVRENARLCFWVFESVWPERGRTILDSLDAIPRKQLEKVCPNPAALGVTPVSTPKVKKSSVAAAIAASRAKAKAIATAPPTLRHQATSTSHAVRATSPPRRAASPSFSSGSNSGMRPASPLSRLASSPPMRPRVTSGSLSRSASSGIAGGLSRSPPAQPYPASPPSPTPDQTFRKRQSSPLASAGNSPPNSSSTFRMAVKTALPGSPPAPVVALASQPARLRPGQSVPAHLPRESLSIAGLHRMAGAEEESFLMATQIPIPEDSDSEMDESMNPVSFSTPFEIYPPVPKSDSQAASFSPKSSSSKLALPNALSTGASSPPAGVPQPIVEDALRARAEQAESAAERLLELVEPEEDMSLAPSLPPSFLLRASDATPKLRAKASGPGTSPATDLSPRTPLKKSAAILKQAAMFQDSPAPNGKSASLFDMVDDLDGASEWWKKRTSLAAGGASFGAFAISESDSAAELQGYISALEQGSADVLVLKKLALLCIANPAEEPSSPLGPALAVPVTPSPKSRSLRSSHPTVSQLWTADRVFDKLFNVLIPFLDPAKDSETLEYGLIVLWEMLEHQAPLLEGHEGDLFTTLLSVRHCAHPNVMQATNMFRDTLTSRIEPVYGLTTLHASIRAFRDMPLPPTSSTEIKDGTYAFGLIAVGKFLLRLPAEVLEDELPRLRTTLISALTNTSSDSSLMVREAAAASIIAAQMVLRDEAHLFALLDGLPDDKKNLLTYLFDKHGSRGSFGAVEPHGMDKLEREMRRLDDRANTPRPSVRSAVAF